MNNKKTFDHNLIEDRNYTIEEIIDKYGNKLLFYINSIINNMSISEDLMEDSFVQIIIKKKTFKDELKFKSYLFKIGRNKAFNYLKRISLIHFENLDESEIPDDKSYIEENYLKKEQEQYLINAMQKLKKEYREILYLLYFENMTYDMAGVILKKNKKQIDNLTYRAKKQLRTLIEKEQLYYEK